jgi:hypothetical protein
MLSDAAAFFEIHLEPTMLARMDAAGGRHKANTQRHSAPGLYIRRL